MLVTHIGLETGTSLVEPDRLELATALIQKAGRKLVLPSGAVVAQKLEPNAPTRTVHRDAIPAGWAMYDIDPLTEQDYAAIIEPAGTIIWNGPMGVFETPPFDHGTYAIAHAMARASDRGAVTVVGGGDSAAAVTEAGLADGMCRPAAERRWSSWKARSCPASPRWTTRDGTPADLRRELEAAPWSRGGAGVCDPVRRAHHAAGWPRALVLPHCRVDLDRRRRIPAARRRPRRGAELSVPLVAEVGATHVLVGHSERRHLFAETADQSARKAGAVLAAGLTALVCVGETLAEREAGRTEKAVQLQLDPVLDAVAPSDRPRLLIAYEPVWAIGTGRNATPSDAAEVHRFIRTRAVGHGWTDRLRVLYGGSVNSGNALAILAEPDVDGVLVGGASLNPDGWAEIVGLGG